MKLRREVKPKLGATVNPGYSCGITGEATSGRFRKCRARLAVADHRSAPWMFAAVVAAIDLNVPGWRKPANADDPPAEDSFAAVVHRAMEVVQGSRMLGPSIDLAPVALQELELAS